MESVDIGIWYSVIAILIWVSATLLSMVLTKKLTVGSLGIAVLVGAFFPISIPVMIYVFVVENSDHVIWEKKEK